MKFAKSILTGTGAVILAAMILALLAPKAAHAIAATLVQVANTAANPAITQNTNMLASQVVELNTTVASGVTDGLFYITLGVGALGQGDWYHVPVNQYLIITSVDITPLSGCGATSVVNLIEGPYFHDLWIVPGVGLTHLTYPSGIVLPPSTIPMIFNNNAASCSVFVTMKGYLTTN
jgi:hypothetical protein